MKQMTASEKLAKAKTDIILDHPFFASLLLPMPMIEDKSVPTLCTNGDVVRYNPDFLDTLSKNEVTFCLAHEVMHCALEHMFRLGDRDLERWNIATDYVVNDVLVAENVGKMPAGCLHDPSIVQKSGGTAEGVYNLLPQPPKQPKGGQDGGGQGGQKGGCFPQPGQPGGPLDHIEAPSDDPQVNKQKAAETKVKVIQARNAAKMAGKLSAGLDRLIDEATKVDTDWRSVLRRFLSERAKTDLSYAKPKRRFLGEDIYLPSLVGEKVGAIAIGVDLSGSVDAELLRQFGAEVKAIAEDVCPSEVRIVYFESEVTKREVFTPETYNSMKLSGKGGGGTAFSPVFAALNADETAPIACVMLTDLYCDDFGPTPDYPVLWASYSKRDSAPFGEVIRVKAVQK